MGTAVLSTTGTAGDVVQLLEVGAALRARGHDVTLVTHATYAGAAEAAGLRLDAVDTADEHARLVDATEGLLDHPHDLARIAAATAWYHTPDRSRREFDAVHARLRDAAGEPAVVVGRFLSALPTLAAAEAAGVARLWALLWPAMLTDLLLDPRPAAQRAADVDAARERLGVGPVGWRAWTRGTPALGLWPHWFGETPEVVDDLELTGFTPADSVEGGPLPPAVRAFLAEGSAPVLITGGSGRMVRPQLYAAAVHGCAHAGLRSLVVTRHRDLAPLRLPDGALWVPAAPFGTLARHMAAAIHHGGISTCARMLAAGLPQVVLAEGVDRPDNGARLARLGVARCLLRPQWTPAAVAAALADVASLRPRAAELATRVRDDRGAERAALVVEQAMRRPPRP